MEKIKLRQAVVVEGKYDKINLSSLIDGVIITTDGFGVFNNQEIIRLIKFYAGTSGIVILTDSDTAGRQIRGRIKSLVDNASITNVYCPIVYGKEKRKTKPSKEGMLGVEGIDPSALRKAFEEAGLMGDEIISREKVTKGDMIQVGLSGAADSSLRRKELARALGLPEELSSAALRDALTSRFGREDFLRFYQDFIGRD